MLNIYWVFLHTRLFSKLLIFNNLKPDINFCSIILSLEKQAKEIK